MLATSWPSFTNSLFQPIQPDRLVTPDNSSTLRWAGTTVARPPHFSSPFAGPSNSTTKRDPLSESKNTPLVPPSSCIDRTSAFFKILTAPYRPPPPVCVEPEEPIDPSEQERCRSMIDWSRPSARDDSPVDEQDASDGHDPSYYEHMNRLVYRPHGQWAWADGLAIEDSTAISHLGSGSMCSTVIKKGVLGGRRITFVSKSWPTQAQDMWQGFHSELALYKSEEYLRPLQGSVVPTVIGVHVLPGEINIAMEPPHHSFWIEASPDMPIVLKERCIEAFEKLHSAGILHGDVELRHMLIGGNGKVTIIDFQASRALIPNEDVMLRKAEPAEFLMEMRKVKYKLDYRDSREKEQQKVNRCEARAVRNRSRRYKHKRRSRGERPGYISDYEDDLKEDKLEPPVHKQDWNDHWVVGSDSTPRRYVMPGQTPELLEDEVKNLLAFVNRLQLERKSAQNEASYISTPPLTPTGFEENTHPSSSPSSSSPHHYQLRKRKANVPVSTVSRKRARVTETLSSLVVASSASSDVTSIQTPTYPTYSTINPHSTITVSPSNETSTFRESGPVDDSSAKSSSGSSNSRYPPIKVRDFAYENYSGPRGYYVPHPPTEARAARERQWHIARLNAQKCFEHKLPHPAVLPHLSGDAQVVRSNKSKKPKVQFGNLKRAREDMENPDAARAWSARKKARYQLAKKAANGEIMMGGAVPDDDAGPDDEYGLADVSEGPRILSRAEYEAHLASLPSSSSLPSASNLHGILRATSPVKLVSQRKEDWIGSHLEKSPKLGPTDLYLRNAGTTVMLGAHYESHPDHDTTLLGNSPLTRKLNRTSDLLALATLGFKLIGQKARPLQPHPQSHATPISADDLTKSDPLQALIEPFPRRKKVQYNSSSSRRQSSSSAGSQTFIKRQPISPSPRRESETSRSPSPSRCDEDERDEADVEALLRSTGDAVPVTSSRSWMSMLLQFFRYQ